MKLDHSSAQLHIQRVRRLILQNAPKIGSLKAFACYGDPEIQFSQQALTLRHHPGEIGKVCIRKAAGHTLQSTVRQFNLCDTLRDLAEQTPLGRLGTPEDIAAAVAFLASEEASFITGQVLTADGGFLV